MTWAQIAEVFRPLAIYYRDLWQCSVPGYNQIASADVEAECDEWCKRLAGHLADPLFPPPYVQGWIVVRLACLASAARFLDKSELSPPEQLDRQTIEWLMIDLWHELLCELWPKLALDEGWSFPE